MKKILCMLLACVLCVSGLGGCMTILIDPEKVVEGRVNLNAYPDIQKQGDDFIQMAESDISCNVLSAEEKQTISASENLGRAR